ncbi:MAG TPA: DUF2249 domain-containing protein [Marmoricola sp.]|nr:DUF2249 domain-containing protein [Marmoricola sp.]
MDIVVASTEADLDAVEAIREHHAAMAGALGGKVTALQRAAHRGEDAVAERDAVVAWARQELLPHAAAEEATIYAAAAERAEARLLVEALVADHRVITDLVDRVAEAPHAVAAAGAAFSLEQLFLAHMAKENDQVLPFLAAEPSVSLVSLLDGMHHELGHEGSHEGSHEHAAAEPGGSGCGGSCGCGEQDGAGDVELDARTVPHAIRHATIFGALDSLGVGTALVLVAPHDPVPLLAQLEQRSPGAFEVSYLERGPEAWRLRLLRRGA